MLELVVMSAQFECFIVKKLPRSGGWTAGKIALSPDDPDEMQSRCHAEPLASYPFEQEKQGVIPSSSGKNVR
jgi:hypothetical protein